MRIRFLPPNVVAACLRFYRRTEQAELSLIAAGVAYFGFLAIFPGLAAVIAIAGFVADPGLIRAELEVLRPVLPPEAYALVSRQLEDLLAVNSSSLGLATILTTAFALWSARAGMAAIIRGLNAIHQRPNRSGHRHQLRALLLTFTLIGLTLSAMILSVMVPLAIGFLPPGSLQRWALEDSGLLVGIVPIVAALILAYRFGPNYGPRRPPLLSWGLLVALVLWATATRGFTLYIAHFPSYNQIYGSIGAVAALMIWLYVSAYAVLLGAAVDAERHRIGRQ